MVRAAGRNAADMGTILPMAATGGGAAAHAKGGDAPGDRARYNAVTIAASRDLMMKAMIGAIGGNNGGGNIWSRRRNDGEARDGTETGAIRAAATEELGKPTSKATLTTTTAKAREGIGDVVADKGIRDRPVSLLIKIKEERADTASKSRNIPFFVVGFSY